MGMCMSSTGVFVSPDVKVVGAKIKSAGLSGVKLDVILVAINPNPASLPATRIIYTLKKVSDGATLADGISRQNVNLVAAADTRITVPMEFKVSQSVMFTLEKPFISHLCPSTLQYWGLGAAGKSMLTRGKTKILVSGEITFDAPMAPGGTATSKFDDEVEVAMEDMMG